MTPIQFRSPSKHFNQIIRLMIPMPAEPHEPRRSLRDLAAFVVVETGLIRPFCSSQDEQAASWPAARTFRGV
jgi:hypothetical protein